MSNVQYERWVAINTYWQRVLEFGIGVVEADASEQAQKKTTPAFEVLP